MERKKGVEGSYYYDSETGIRFYYYSNPGNCKFVTLDYIASNLRDINRRKAFFGGLKELHGQSKTTGFLVTLLRKEDVMRIAEEFPMIYCVKIPFGYGDGFQYHASFAFSKDNYYIERMEKESVKLENL